LDRRFKRVKPQRQKSSAPPVRRGKRDELDFDDVIYGIHAVKEALEAGEGAPRCASPTAQDGPLRAYSRLPRSRTFRSSSSGGRLPGGSLQSASGRGGDRAAVPVRYARRDCEAASAGSRLIVLPRPSDRSA
jgi:hypothetical protein